MLAPAGNRISLSHSGDKQPDFDNYDLFWLNKGTSALALAMSLSSKLNKVDKPEIIIPSYGCPDIVSACLYSGVRPVLCDIGQQDPGYDLQQLNEKVSTNTIAIVAVNFLGIRENLEAISDIINNTNKEIFLIEDNAQWFPDLRENTQGLMGDFVIMSFSRGKPLSLLGGAILLVKQCFLDELTDNLAPFSGSSKNNTINKAKFYSQCIAYNILLNPKLYGLISRLPFLKLGETTYKKLESIITIDEDRHKLFYKNYELYLERNTDTQNKIEESLIELNSNLTILPNTLSNRTGRLLRFPILAQNENDRDKLIQLLNHRGLGASKLYREPMWKIKAIPGEHLKHQGCINAEIFSKRLITLPTHDHVSNGHINKIRDLIKDFI